MKFDWYFRPSTRIWSNGFPRSIVPSLRAIPLSRLFWRLTSPKWTRKSPSKSTRLCLWILTFMRLWVVATLSRLVPFRRGVNGNIWTGCWTRSCFWTNRLLFSLISRNHSFGFQVTAAMAPSARVVVYYVRKDGEVVADALNFDVEGIFQNFVGPFDLFANQDGVFILLVFFDVKVEVQVAPNSVEPGKAVDVTVKAEPNSYVGVLAVDQSVLLLRSGNDITRVSNQRDSILKNVFFNVFFKQKFQLCCSKMCSTKWRRTILPLARITLRGSLKLVVVLFGGPRLLRLQKSSV